MSQLQNNFRIRLSIRNYLSLKGIIYVSIVLILMLLFLEHTGSMFVEKTEMPLAVEPVGMENNVEYRQKIPYTEGELKGFQVEFGTYGRSNNGRLKASLIRDNTELQTWEIDTVKLVDNSFRKFEIADPVRITPYSSYFIVLNDRYEGTNGIAFYTSRDSNKIEYGGNVLSGRSFSVIYEIGNNTQGSFYQKAFTIFLIFVIIVTSIFINPKEVNTLSYILFLVCGILCFRVFDYNIFQNLSKVEYVADWQQSQKYDTIEPGISKKYNINLSHMQFDTFKIYLEGENRENIHIRIVKNDGVSYFDDDIGSQFIIGEGRTGKTAVLAYRQETFAPGLYTVEIKNTGEKAFQVSVRDNGDLNFGLSNHTLLSVKIALFIIAMLVIYVALIFILLAYSSKLNVEKWFLVTVIPFAAIYLVLFAPWSQPDTGAHMYATYRLSNKILGYDEADRWKGRKEDAEFMQYVWGQDSNPSLKSYSGISAYSHFICDKPEIVDLPSGADHMIFYSAINYLPQVLGLTLGRLLNLSTVISIYLGRIFILLLYIVVMYRNIKKIPCGKWIIATVALLPMALMMSSAVSYDAMVIISSLSFITCVLRLRRENTILAYIETVFWAFIAGAVKGGGYVLILLPLLFTVFDNNDKKNSLFKIAGVAAAGCFSVLLFDKLIPASLGFQFGSDSNSRYTAAFALHEPLKYLDMAMSSYFLYIDALSINIGGTNLAWLEGTIPATVIALFMLIGGVQSVFEKDKFEPRKFEIWFGVFILVIGILCIPAMLLSWTYVDSHMILGLQGRYFLPLLPIFYYVTTKFALHAYGKQNHYLIMKKGIIWMSFLSSIFVYYMMKLYLTR